MGKTLLNSPTLSWKQRWWLVKTPRVIRLALLTYPPLLTSTYLPTPLQPPQNNLNETRNCFPNEIPPFSSPPPPPPPSSSTRLISQPQEQAPFLTINASRVCFFSLRVLFFLSSFFFLPSFSFFSSFSFFLLSSSLFFFLFFFFVSKFRERSIRKHRPVGYIFTRVRYERSGRFSKRRKEVVRVVHVEKVLFKIVYRILRQFEENS